PRPWVCLSRRSLRADSTFCDLSAEILSVSYPNTLESICRKNNYRTAAILTSDGDCVSARHVERSRDFSHWWRHRPRSFDGAAFRDAGRAHVSGGPPRTAPEGRLQRNPTRRRL